MGTSCPGLLNGLRPLRDADETVYPCPGKSKSETILQTVSEDSWTPLVVDPGERSPPLFLSHRLASCHPPGEQSPQIGTKLVPTSLLSLPHFTEEGTEALKGEMGSPRLPSYGAELRSEFRAR